jgi:hypothetical protein
MAINALFAAGVDQAIIRLIVLLLIFGLPAIGRLLNKMQAAKQQQIRPPAPPADAASEIEEFLRRAKQTRETETPKPAEESRPLRRQTIKKPAAQDKPKPAPVEATAAPVALGAEVTEHVNKYLDADEFSRRSAQLGGEVAKADSEIDQHLHQVFDHSLSQLSARPSETAEAAAAVEPAELSASGEAEAAPVFAVDLADMLAKPESMAQAVVLSEILSRPAERW